MTSVAIIDSPVDGLQRIGAFAMERVTVDALRTCLGAGASVLRRA